MIFLFKSLTKLCVPQFKFKLLGYIYTYRSIYLHVYSIRSLIYTFPLNFLRKRKFIVSYMFKFKIIIFWTVYITKYIFINANVGDVLLSKVCVSYLLQLKAVMISSLHKRRKKNFTRIRLYFIPLLLLFFFICVIV